MVKNELISVNTENKSYQNIIVENAVNAFNVDIKTLNEISSRELYNILLIGRDNPHLYIFLMKYHDLIIIRCLRNFDLYDYFVIMFLVDFQFCKEKCSKIFKNTTLKVFSPKTLLFLKKISKTMLKEYFLEKSMYDLIIEKLNEERTDDASRILIDLNYFVDFKTYLKKTHPTAEFIIEKNQEAYPYAKGRDMLLGGSIIAKLIRSNHWYIIEKWISILQNVNLSPDKSVKIIGMGSTAVVFKIGDEVLKIGETRYTRKIYQNHRILSSTHRKLYHNDKGEELFYIETMKFAHVGDVSIEERDELVSDLRSQGLIWHDTKLENCGVLVDGDENLINLKVDYEEVAGIINNPVKKLEFKNRNRKVIVIDNDLIEIDPRIYHTMK